VQSGLIILPVLPTESRENSEAGTENSQAESGSELVFTRAHDDAIVTAALW